MNKTLLGSEIALTPPMGWNSFNTFGCEPSEALIKGIADAMIETGLKNAGYLYINIDDGWMGKSRDDSGNLYPHPDKFPNGLKVVTDYIHSKGLKAGIYLGCGIRTYGEYPGSLGYEKQDAKLIAEMGFDLLKYDYRTLPEDPIRGTVREDFETMRDALIETGRPILFSICEHGKSCPWEWGNEVGHMWRTTPDIKDGYDGNILWGWGFNKIIDNTHHYYPFAVPGAWNDPDMLIVGLNGKIEWQGPGCTLEEYRTHFALWCISCAPLLIGCDIRKMDSDSKAILMNKDLIAINQDRLGKQGYIAKRLPHFDIWKKELENNQCVIGLYNRSCDTHEIMVDLRDLGINTYQSIKNLYEEIEISMTNHQLSYRIKAHAFVLIKVSL